MDVEKIIREYIDKSIHMSLGTSSNNKPWVCEVHFGYDDDLNLYFRSLKSRRHSQEIAKNPFVAGNIVRQHSLDEIPHGIYFEGKAELLGPGEDQKLAYKVLKERLNVPDKVLEEAAHEEGHQFYKIIVNKWYAFGKFGGDSVNKHELEWNN